MPELQDHKSTISEIEKAKQLLAKENDEKVAKCKLELEQLMEKSGCLLNVSMLVTPNGNIPQVNISVKTS